MGKCCTALERWVNIAVWKLLKHINTQTVLERFKEDKGEDNISQQQRYHLEVVKLLVLILLLLAV